MKNVKTIYISGKTNDLCVVEARAANGRTIKTHDGYVPKFMPEQHFGDYIELHIDIATGRILNWTPPSSEEILSQLNGR